MKKSVLIVLGIIEAALLLIAVSAVGINNRAISLEEQISGAEAKINVAEKRRVDLVYNLVDTVIAYQEYEGETMRAITEARASARSGDADSAMTPRQIYSVVNEYGSHKKGSAIQLYHCPGYDCRWSPHILLH